MKRIDDEMQKAAAAKKGIPIDVNRGESGSEGDSPAGAIRAPRRKVQKILESKMAESSLHVEVEEYR